MEFERLAGLNYYWICKEDPCLELYINGDIAELNFLGGGYSLNVSLEQLEEIVAFMKQKQGQLRALDDLTADAQELGLYGE